MKRKNKLSEEYKTDENGYVNFGEIARGELGMQCQYASYYVNGIDGRPKLAEGLRITQDEPSNYHSIKIHKDDIPEFVSRVKKYCKERYGR